MVSFSFIPGIVLYLILGTNFSLVLIIAVHRSFIAPSVSWLSLLLRPGIGRFFSSSMNPSQIALL